MNAHILKLRWFWVAIALGLIVILSGVLPGWCTEYQSDLLGYGEYPQINGSGQAVWTDGAGGVFLYNGESPTQIADNYSPSPANSPLISDSPARINNSSQVVWQGWDGQDHEIFLYDGGAVTQITNNTYDDLCPQINDSGRIVWQGWDGTDYEIYDYRGGYTGQITNNTYDDVHAHLSDGSYEGENGRIVWDVYNTSDTPHWEIYEYRRGVTQLIAGELAGPGYPQVNSGGDVFWSASVGEEFSYIYRYSPWEYPGPIEIDGVDYIEDVHLRINDNGQAVYAGNSGETNEVWFYQSDSVLGLGNNPSGNPNPHLNNYGQVAWQGWDEDGADHEILVTDYYGATVQLTDNNYDDLTPQINDKGQVVWQTSDGAIYLATPMDTRYDFIFEYNVYDAQGYVMEGIARDSYTGYLLANYDSYYQVGDTRDYTDEWGRRGRYTITDISTYPGVGHAGEVYVDLYHDAESDADYVPINSTDPAGTWYLGSEHGYIIEAGVPAYFFGTDDRDHYFYEAEANPAASDFTYSWIGSGGKYLQINDSGQMIWVGGASDQELYLHDQGVTTLIAANLYAPMSYNHAPQLNAAGDIAWLGYDGNDTEIFLYHDGVPTQVTDNSTNEWYVRLNDSGQVVWSGTDGHDYEIYRYSEADGIEQITDNAYDDKNPQVNNSGQIAWYGWDGQGNEIFLYDESFGISPLTDFNYPYNYTFYPEINDSGQVVWSGWDGQDAEIFLYDGNDILQLTNNHYNDYEPRINALGQVAWYDSSYFMNLYDGGTVTQLEGKGSSPRINDQGQVIWSGYYHYYNQIFLYQDGVTIPITDTGNRDNSTPAINNNGNIVWTSRQTSPSWSPTSDIYLYPAADEAYARYDFTFYYDGGDGDYYSGWVYAPAGFGGYEPGYRQDVTDEHGRQGYYEITQAVTGTAAIIDPDLMGQVFVNQYVDSESSQGYVPLSQGQAVGADYLGSEHDYIIQDGYDYFYFGRGDDGTFYDADLMTSFDFRLTYSNGDYYTGRVFANLDYGYAQGDTWSMPVEEGLTGTYEITEVGSIFYPLTWQDGQACGEVYIYRYYDVESDVATEVLAYWEAAGTQYLGSESNYIFAPGSAPHLFGAAEDGVFHEADFSWSTPEYTYAWIGVGPYGYADQGQLSQGGQVVFISDDDENCYTETSLYLYESGIISKIPGYFYDYGATNSSGQVVWQGYDEQAGDTEIFLYQGGAVTQLTDNAFEDFYPQINEPGQIAWQSQEDSGWVLYLYQDGVATPIATNPNSSFGEFQLSDSGWVVWSNWDGSSDAEIYRANLSGAYQVTDNDVEDFYPSVNANGDIVWVAGESASAEVFLFDGTEISQITDNGYQNSNPQINDRGEMVWSTYDGQDSYISYCAYPGAEPVNISPDILYSYNPRINAEGQVVWIGTDGNDEEIYLYANGMVTQFTNNDSDDFYPQINDQGQILWQGWGGGLILATPTAAPEEYAQYDFTFYYDNGDGDSYTGSVYAPLDYGYQVGYTQEVQDEYGLTGYYVIDDMTPGTFGLLDGQVYVDSYFDADTWQAFTPVLSETLAGLNYLGSESGYILQEGNAAFFFGTESPGGIFYEADISWSANGYNCSWLGQGEPPLIGDLDQAVWAGPDAQGQDLEIFLYWYGGTIQLTDNDYDDATPQISTGGQVVWTGFDSNDWEIFAYQDGSIIQITDNSYDDYYPQVNADGQIVWVAGADGATEEVFLYCDGFITQLTNNGYDDTSPQLNAIGDVVWMAAVDNGDWEILLYRDATITQLTNNSLDDSLPQIAANGDIIWSGWDGNDTEIYLFSQGAITQITQNDFDDNDAVINAQGQVGWWSFDGLNDEIYLYHDGAITQITQNDYSDCCPMINSSGQITWFGYPVAEGSSEVYVYKNGDIVQLTDNGYDDYWSAINDSGQIIWQDGSANIYLATPIVSEYEFTLTFSTGDYYTGVVYAGAEQGYYLNYTESVPDEFGGQATYEITGLGSDYWDPVYVGQVIVDRYHDAETGLDLETFILGTDYLGSEQGYLLFLDNPDLLVGAGADGLLYAADLSWSTPDFTFNFVGLTSEWQAEFNDQGQVVWNSYESDDYWPVFLYDGGSIIQITDKGYNPHLNNLGEIVWLGPATSSGDSDIYLYRNEEIIPITTDGHVKTWALINDQGDILWYDYEDDGLYLYHDQAITLITDNVYGDEYFQLNQAGQVAWLGFDGGDTEIYLYSGGVTTQISDNSYSDWDFRLNDAGEIVWAAGPSYGDQEIYLYRQGETLTLTDNDYDEVFPSLNNRGRVAWADYGETTSGIRLYEDGSTTILTEGYVDFMPLVNDLNEVAWVRFDDLALTASIYRYRDSLPTSVVQTTSDYFSFFIDWETLRFNNQGQLLFLLGEGIILGTPTSLPELPVASLTGEVTAANNESWDYSYDLEFTEQNLLVDVDIYLTGDDPGLELQAIWEMGIEGIWGGQFFIQDGAYTYPILVNVDWVGSAEEADYTVTVHDGTGSANMLNWYTDQPGGWPNIYQDEIAAHEFGHMLGLYDEYAGGALDPETLLIANNALMADLGPVQERYFQGLLAWLEGETGRDLSLAQAQAPPYQQDEPIPGYEDPAPQYMVYPYAFQFQYPDGDYYIGTVYAGAAEGYDLGYTFAVPVEGGQQGNYRITGIGAGTQDTSQLGQVFVQLYHDGESGKEFVPLKYAVTAPTPAGLAFLGSEADQIIKSGVSDYQFGAGSTGFQEADLVTGWVNVFRFTYSCGDYYIGMVLSDPAEYRYYLGYTQESTDENGQISSYEIIDVWSAERLEGQPQLPGRVYVFSYYDYETKRWFLPVEFWLPMGLDYLGSEYGYIMREGVERYYFGGGFYEADVKKK